MDHEKDILQDEQSAPISLEENDIQEQSVSCAEEKMQMPENTQDIPDATMAEEVELPTERQERQPIAGNDPVRIGVPNAPYGMPGGPNYGTNGQNSAPRNPDRRITNPYAPGYYAQNSYGNPPYGGYNGNYYAPSSQGNMYVFGMQDRPAMPVKKKNRKSVVSMIFGALAVGIMNYFPFIGLILAVIALCTAFAGLKDNRITPGKKACGIIGMGLGAFALTISIAMLVMLLTMSIKVMNMGAG